MISKKHKNTRRNLNYFEHFLLFILAASSCVSISAFALSVNISVCVTSSALWLKICATTPEIQKYKWIIKKKKKKYDKIVLLAKTKLNTIKILISKTLINSCINHDEFVSVNNMLREYNETKE